MALNIKDPKTEALAPEVSALTGMSKTAAVPDALHRRRSELVHRESADRRTADFLRFLREDIGAGAEELHVPAVHPEYHENYYGAFVRDPDSNNVEAVCHRPE